MGTRYQGTPEETRALSAYINLMRAVNSVTARVHEHLAGADLTLGQFGALEALHFVGSMRHHELAGKLLCTPGNMTKVLDNLESRGLVSRRRDDGDRRCQNVAITARGRRAIEAIFPGHAEGLVRSMSGLTAGELEELRVLCRKLGRGVPE
jgi:MarR family 2-MHQ and catechol resistance regulon transcriptional repressor